MRDCRKHGEQYAIEEMLKALNKAGSIVTEIQGVTDRPDALFHVDGKKVAIECRTFTPERVLRLHGIKMVDGEQYQLYLPIEPYTWVRDAVEAKAKKVNEYIERSGADSCWLVLHSERGGFTNLGQMYHSDLSKLFEKGAWCSKHSFERVYLLGEDDLAPTCIYNVNNKKTDKVKYERLKIFKIPVIRYWFTKTKIKKGANGNNVVAWNFNQELKQNILLQPLDTNFKADYSEIECINNAFEAVKELPGMIIAEPTSDSNINK